VGVHEFSLDLTQGPRRGRDGGEVLAQADLADELGYQDDLDAPLLALIEQGALGTGLRSGQHNGCDPLGEGRRKQHGLLRST